MKKNVTKKDYKNVYSSSNRKTFAKIISLLVFLFIFIFFYLPPRFVEFRYPEIKTWNFEKKTSNLGFPTSYLVFRHDPCSGLECVQIKCYKVVAGFPIYIGEDIATIPLDKVKQIDNKKCIIISKTSSGDNISESIDKNYWLRYSNEELELVTPTNPIILDQITDKNLVSSNVVWDTTNKRMYISYIKEGTTEEVARNGSKVFPRNTYVALVSLTTGNTLKEVEITNGFYGINIDRAFPIVVNLDKNLLAIQSDYIQSFTVFNSNLSLRGVYKTKWSDMEMFSDEMYALKDFNMWLNYSWKNNNTIEYGFIGSNNLYLLKIN